MVDPTVLRSFASPQELEDTLQIKVGDVVAMKCLDPSDYSCREGRVFHVMYGGYSTTMTYDDAYLFGDKWIRPYDLWRWWAWYGKDKLWHKFGIERSEDDYDDTDE